MSIVQIDDYARQLYSAHGDRAEYEAAREGEGLCRQGRQRDCPAMAAGARGDPGAARPERQLTRTGIPHWRLTCPSPGFPAVFLFLPLIRPPAGFCSSSSLSPNRKRRGTASPRFVGWSA